MTNIFVFLGVSLSRRTMVCSQWLRVTALKLVAEGDFVMKFPLKMLSSGQREAAG